jgi:hypothetical protein
LSNKHNDLSIEENNLKDSVQKTRAVMQEINKKRLTMQNEKSLNKRERNIF